MLRFRQMKTLQKFASVCANVHHGIVRANAPLSKKSRVAVWQRLLWVENGHGRFGWKADASERIVQLSKRRLHLGTRLGPASA